MAEDEETTGWTSASRGEAAWKEAKDHVASRNAEARREGKRRRETYERGREDARRAAAAKQRADLLKRPAP